MEVRWSSFQGQLIKCLTLDYVYVTMVTDWQSFAAFEGHFEGKCPPAGETGVAAETDCLPWGGRTGSETRWAHIVYLHHFTQQRVELHRISLRRLCYWWIMKCSMQTNSKHYVPTDWIVLTKVAAIYTMILLKYVCLSQLANCRSQFLLHRLGRCLELFVSTESTNPLTSLHLSST